MATIYEVARMAGVSPATVSRVFNGQRVSEARASAVREAASVLKFTPNRTARTLRRQESEVIALLLPDIENPYFTELARGVEDIAQGAGYSVVMCNTDSDVDKEARYLQIAVSEHMAGVIIAAASARSRLRDILAAGHPMVAVDRRTEHRVDGVLMADREAGAGAAQALVDAGYRRIACISGPREIETATERADGWRAVTAAHRPALDLESLLCHTDFRVDGGRDAMARLLALPHPPDAVVAANNLIGVGALQVLTERGLTPPKVGVAVVGSLPFTTLPPDIVTIVRLPARHMGLTAARMLLERIGGDDQPARTVVLHSEVIPAAAGAPRRSARGPATR